MWFEQIEALEWVSVLKELWPGLVATWGFIFALLASVHAILNKRDTRAAVGWVGLIYLAPFVGVILYLLLGINRIKRRAEALQRKRFEPGDELSLPEPELYDAVGPDGHHLHSLALLTRRVVHRKLEAHNQVRVLHNGDEAYPLMLDAIKSAQKSVHLSTYIFDNDPVGKAFAQALGDAKKRGVTVRVLVDAVGLRYSWPWPITGELKKYGIKAAKFLPTRFPWRMPYTNLRNHRKILLVDGRIGFTGGMNIREGHELNRHSKHPVRDLHFLYEGPVVCHLQEAFAEDWNFSSPDKLSREDCEADPSPMGKVICRGIKDGPDEDLDKLRWAYYGAIDCAQSYIKIVTPYFLPDQTLIMALNSAALRGVEVDIVLPEKNNLRLVQWASQSLYDDILVHGCRIWLNPPPFDHSKLMVVDGAWSLVGSGNWDPRSLRLNFEFNIENYSTELAEELNQDIEMKIKDSKQLSLDGFRKRSFFARLRDGTIRLLTPYL
ncbi:MAG: cardiolipin synthase [Myxococcales bacterium]|nr:MAG: cardiolipin synthase [Myxococcales bacterium]